MTMTDTDKLLELVVQWEESQADERPLTPEELCRDSPELLEPLKKRIERLKRMEWMAPSYVPTESSDSRSALEIGLELAGRYVVERKLGEGGYGSVYRSFDKELCRTVAVKIAHRGVGRDAEALLAEARRAATLRHPNIVNVYDVGRHDGSVFIVSELIDGATLAELIAAKKIDADRVRSVISDVANALSFAHKQGFVHRDVKPSNILIDEQGRAHLADFGIAVSSKEEVFGGYGTLAYMAPELIAEAPATIRSDVYALGVCLFEASAGRLPSAAERLELAKTGRVQGMKLPSVIGRVCRRCLAVATEDRYGSANEIAERLQRAERTLTHPSIVAPVGLLSVGALAFALWWSLTGGLQETIASSTPESPQEILVNESVSKGWLETKATAEPSVEVTTSPEPSLVEPATAASLPVTANIEPEPTPAEAVVSPIPTEPVVLQGHTDYVTCLDVSYDGNRIVSGSNDRTVRLWDAQTGETLWSHGGFDRIVRAVRLSEGTQEVQVCTGDCICVLNLTTGDEKRRASIDLVLKAEFSADGKYVSAIRPGSTAVVHDVPSGEVAFEVSQQHSCYVAQMVPDTPKLLTGVNSLTRYELYSGRKQETPIHHSRHIEAIDICLPANVIATGSGKPDGEYDEAPGKGDVMLWSLNPISYRGKLGSHDGFVWSLAFSPDGRRLASGGGGDTKDFYAHRGSDRAIRIWNVDSQALDRELRGHEGAVLALDFFSDGKRVASGSADKTIRIWNLD